MAALADRSSDSGFSFPGLRLLQSDTEMGERTVLRTLQDLEDGGWLTIVQPTKGGERKGNSYQLRPEQLWLEQSGSRDKELEYWTRELPAAKADALKADALNDTKHLPLTTGTPAFNDSPIRKNHKEPSLEPNAAPQLVLASPSAPKPEKREPWTEANVGAILKLTPKEYRGDKQPACKNIRLALGDLQAQGFEWPAEVLEERVSNWWADYAVKEKAARAAKAFLKHPGDAEGWFNPKTRRRYMSDEALTPRPEKTPDVDPLEKILAQQAQALAEKHTTEGITYADANAA